MEEKNTWRETYSCPVHLHPLEKINIIGAKVRETARRLRRPGMSVVSRHVQADQGRHAELHVYEFRLQGQPT